MKVYTTFILSASITRGVTYVKLTHTVAEGRPGYRADPKFEIRVPSHLASGDLAAGSQESLCTPRDRAGGRGHFRGETRSRSCPSGA